MLDSTSATVQTLFNRIAPVYDDLNQCLSLGQHKIWKLMAVKWAEPRAGDRALDLCCGSGDVALMLAERVGVTGEVYGVDFAAEQLSRARSRANPPNLHWVQANVLDLPFGDDFFNCATMSYGLRNVGDIARSLQELQRVLQPGAKAALLDMHRPESAWMRQFQQWYLQQLVVPTARHFGLTEEYAYIAPSLERFPQGAEQVRLAQEAGFAQGVHYAIAGGTMGVLVVQKAVRH
jgi:demethylmenaquinone methyltransferase/2-methoxy-6-polyprenyl-1,4-benzoquinol methylase